MTTKCKENPLNGDYVPGVVLDAQLVPVVVGSLCHISNM